MGKHTDENTVMKINRSTAMVDEVNMSQLCRQDWDTGQRNQLNVGIGVGHCMYHGELPHLTLCLFL